MSEPTPEFITPAQAGRMLGIKDRHTIRRQIDAGTIPSVRIGNTTRIPLAELRKVLEVKQTKAAPLLVTRKRTMKLLHCSYAKVKALIASGDLKVITSNNQTLVTHESIAAYVARAADAPKAPKKFPPVAPKRSVRGNSPQVPDPFAEYDNLPAVVPEPSAPNLGVHLTVTGKQTRTLEDGTVLRRSLADGKFRRDGSRRAAGICWPTF